MNALEFIVGLLARGVVFDVDGDRLTYRHLGESTTPGERALISALKPTIRNLLRTELPVERATAPCEAFEAHVALCRECGFNLPAHFWRLPTCTFFTGAASEPLCRRCGVPRLEHVPSGVQL